MDRNQQVSKLKEYHTQLTSKDYYLPKCFYTPNNSSQRFQLFTSELEKECDIYIEAVSKENIPETVVVIDKIYYDMDRTLWKLPYNPHWRTDYELKIYSKDLWIIPTSKLILVPKESIEKVKFTKQPNKPSREDIKCVMNWLNNLVEEYA